MGLWFLALKVRKAFKKGPFLNRLLLRNGSFFFRKVTFHMLNVKRVLY